MPTNFVRWLSSSSVGVLLVVAQLAVSVEAGTLQLDRTRIDLSARQPVSEFAIDNTGPKPSLVQTQVFRWTQDGNQHQLEPSDELLVSPPIAEIAPGESQLLRVGLLAQPDARVETTYRLIVQEVPRPEDSEDGTTVSVLLRLSFPVFVQPTTTASPDLVWGAARTTGNQLKLTLSNIGTAHARVQGIVLALPDGTVVAEVDSNFAYVLPGETHSWDLETHQRLNGNALRLSAGTGQGEVHVDLELEDS